jgi:hypothetical protein
MGMERFKAPALPVPPVEYDQKYHTDLIRVLRIYFNQLDSTTPLVLDGLQLLNLPTSGYGLRTGTVFRVGEDLKIVVPNIAYLLGISASGSLGAISVVLGPPGRPLGVSASGSLGAVSVTTAP